jgi:hypothetical protein
MKSPVKSKSPTAPRVLILDIETKPIRAFVWDIWEINVALNQIEEDWSILSYAAKWLNEPASKMFYEDVRKEKDYTNDKKIMQGIWELLDEADIIITQNGKSFDEKRLNARFIMHKMDKPSSYRHIDTKRLSKKHFAFTSHGLEYMTDKLCTKYKKLSHKKFPGQSLWTECLKGNKEAWKEMEVYNKHDVLSLEELYNVMAPWDDSINWNVFTPDSITRCRCGSTSLRNKGYHYTKTGMFRRWKCNECGTPVVGRENLLTKEKRRSLKP